MYKKFLFTLILLLLTIIPVKALTLTGGITYTTDSARAVAFDNVDSHININKYKEYFQDCCFNENTKNFKNIKYKDRKVTIFENRGYAVTYKKNKRISYYYNSNGRLEYIAFSTLGKYPRKTLKYDIKGELVSSALSTAPKEQYVFDLNKKLVVHWIGDNCYNEKGELIGKRKSH